VLAIGGGRQLRLKAPRSVTYIAVCSLVLKYLQPGPKISGRPACSTLRTGSLPFARWSLQFAKRRSIRSTPRLLLLPLPATPLGTQCTCFTGTKKCTLLTQKGCRSTQRARDTGDGKIPKNRKSDTTLAVSEGLACLTSAIERAVAPVASAASDLASAQARKKEE